MGSVVLAIGAVGAAFERFMQPQLVTGSAGPVKIGVPDEYSVGSLTFVETARSYLARDERGFYAILATCTHLGCTPREDGNAFLCPCHGSRFSNQGGVLNGPASRPLERAFVGQLGSGHLFIDAGRIVEPDYRFAVEVN